MHNTVRRLELDPLNFAEEKRIPPPSILDGKRPGHESFICEVGPSAWFCSSELPHGPRTFCRQSSECENDPFGRGPILLGETRHESEQLPTEKSISPEVCLLPLIK